MSDLHAGSRSDRLDQAIHGLLSQTPEIEAAAVVSFDGLPMAAALPPSMDEDRVAAMSAALLSLGERAAQGLGRGELSQVYIEGETGTVFLIFLIASSWTSSRDDAPNPIPSRAMSDAPALVVMIRMVFLKSTVLPW